MSQLGVTGQFKGRSGAFVTYCNIFCLVAAVAANLDGEFVINSNSFMRGLL